MEIILTNEAKQDLQSIVDYISQDEKQNALKVWERISKAIDRLADFPDSGIFPKDDNLKAKGYRMLVSDSYLIFYVVLRNHIEIRAIINGVREYGKLIE